LKKKKVKKPAAQLRRGRAGEKGFYCRWTRAQAEARNERQSMWGGHKLPLPSREKHPEKPIKTAKKKGLEKFGARGLSNQTNKREEKRGEKKIEGRKNKVVDSAVGGHTAGHNKTAGRGSTKVKRKNDWCCTITVIRERNPGKIIKEPGTASMRKRRKQNRKTKDLCLTAKKANSGGYEIQHRGLPVEDYAKPTRAREVVFKKKTVPTLGGPQSDLRGADSVKALCGVGRGKH